MAVAAAARSAPAVASTSARFEARLAGASGRALRLEGLWRPVIGLGEAKLRGLVLHVDVREAADGLAINAAALNAVDIERIDLTAAERGLAALDPAAASDHPPLVFVPVSWTTARSPRARRRLLQAAGKAQARLRMLPIAELYGLDGGVPPGLVRETVGLLQPMFRGVLARVAPRRSRIGDLADCGLMGAAVEAGDLAESSSPEAMLRTVLGLQRMGPGVMLHSLRSVAALTAARAAGARWASLDIAQCGWHVAHAAMDALTERPA